MNLSDLRAIEGIVIDPGHGGEDTGSVSGNVEEKNLNLEVSQYIYDRFKQLGVPVYITREDDETVDRDERLNRIKSAFGDKSNVILISNHINSGGAEGAEVIYALRNNDTLAKSVLESIGAEGQIMRKYYQRRLPSDTSKDYYFVQRMTDNLQPILVEYGYIDNSRDLARVQSNLLRYGEAVVRAVMQYIGRPYTPPSGSSSNVYIVQKGDSLYSIAKKYNVTVDELRKANNLKTDSLSIGQYLVIPTKTPPQPEEPSNYITYTVKAGDSLYNIAQRYNVTVDEIKKASNITSNNLSIGQQLRIPTKPVLPPQPEMPNYITYTVKAGDTLYNIAKKYDVSVSDIIDFNQLASTSLSIGQQLLIPVNEGSNIEETIYTVVAGDSLWKIANKYGVSVDDIIYANKLNNTSLQIGDKLKIPLRQEEFPEEGEEEIDVVKYTVKSGDNLYDIAKKYNVTVDQIKNKNNLTSNSLSIGQVLLIPSTNDYMSYVVQSGDSLYSIAKRFNTTADIIKDVNNLNSNMLSIGQTLQIPL